MAKVDPPLTGSFTAVAASANSIVWNGRGALFLRGTFAGVSVQPQIRDPGDASVWHDVGSPLAAAGVLEIDTVITGEMRLNNTSFTSGEAFFALVPDNRGWIA